MWLAKDELISVMIAYGDVLCGLFVASLAVATVRILASNIVVIPLCCQLLLLLCPRLLFAVQPFMQHLAIVVT